MNKQLLRAQLLIVLSLSFIQTFAQPGGTQPDPNMLSAAGNSFGINNFYNSNLFDGTVDVRIPIYTYSKDEMDFSVSFNYNTKGVLVDEVENPEGLHWNLSAQNSIQRIVKDIPDEINYNSNADSLYEGDTALWNINKYVKGKLFTYWETPAQKAMTNVYRDGESDDFIVNLNGKTFTFNLGNELTTFTHPKRNVKIQLLLNGAPVYSFTNQIIGPGPGDNDLSFQITDEIGTVYLFEPGEHEHKTFYDNIYWDDGQLGHFFHTLKWNVKKVTFADGSEITYNYTYSWLWGYGLGSYTRYKNHLVRENSNGTREYRGVKWEGPSTPMFSQLVDINYPNGNSVKFVYDGTNVTTGLKKQLKEIQVLSRREPQNCFRYKLFQSKPIDRWYLDSIKIVSCDNSFEEKYFSFEYNAVKLPNRLNTGQDLFGYFNADSIATEVNGSGNKINIPKHNYNTPGSANYGLGKSYLPYYAQAGLLIKVKNAYGGEVKFVYKANSNDIASPFVVPGGSSNNLFVGTGTLGMDGVAIDSIIEKERFHLNEAKITVIDYHNSGRLFTPGGYVHYPEYINSQTNVWEKVMFQGLYLTAHQFVNGSNHGYSNVGLKKYNSSGQLLSRTEYTFTNIADALSSSRFYKVNGSKELYEFPYSNKQYIKDWEIGLPLSVTVYDNNNRIVTKTENIYDFSSVDLSASSYITNTKKSKVNTGALVNVPFGDDYYSNKIVFPDTYYPYTGTANLSKTITKKYISDIRFVSDTAEYFYDEKNNLSSIITKDSKGDRFSTNLIYNYTVDGPNSSWAANPNTVLYNMTSIGLERVVGIERWKMAPGILPYSNALINANITRYSWTPGKLWEKGRFDFIANAPVTYTQYTGISMGSPIMNPYGKILAAYNTAGPVPYFQKTREITLFDAEGKPLEIKYLNLNKYASMIWDTAIDAKVAEASNCRQNEIAYTSFEDIGIQTGNIVRGNLVLNSTKIITAATALLSGVSGKYIYVLSPPNILGNSDIIGSQQLTAGKEYILSFWSHNGIPKVYYGSTLLPIPTAATYEYNGWSNYIYKFNAGSTPESIHIAPQPTIAIHLDEIRLQPVDALMTSWTYNPLYGMSSVTDHAGRISYYEYDEMGRLYLTKDQEGNITEKIKQVINGGL
ncbi:hypothetical protein J7E50_10925 [Pedobacter sp. ISL-68]|uniref:hypothetical protein n=1 Tax=unclassified Pedobacter TaxID=2628915 RepID=UPI001BE6FEB9|nr:MULTISPECIES: hypothetical protein [unclassified Pedobacter]MBT2561345.1 hypothetical protein [Pedobacter sp. ISL-64]MBT2590734.1 hypothetical protein [Pedobacter sp. ISL-68]